MIDYSTLTNFLIIFFIRNEFNTKITSFCIHAILRDFSTKLIFLYIWKTNQAYIVYNIDVDWCITLKILIHQSLSHI